MDGLTTKVNIPHRLSRRVPVNPQVPGDGAGDSGMRS